ncbi:hypothetical protein DRJ25_00555 [Candidatus Woesearchaeota archaeon]|nr:MAG: hypothetical protein DRJ25_00555 [Candidatus Woesearchaeota archaeon]
MLQDFIVEKNKYFIDGFNGDFVFLSSSPCSKFGGFFARLGNDWFRTISFIENLECACCLEGGFYFRADGDVFLDCRRIFDLRAWGRHYVVSIKGNHFGNVEDYCVVVRFSKVNDPKEPSGEEYSLFLAIRGDFSFSLSEEWVKHEYPFDLERNSPPFSRFVFRLGRISGSACMSVSFDEADAVKKVKILHESLDKLLLQKELVVESFAEGIKDVVPVLPVKSVKSAKLRKTAVNKSPDFMTAAAAAAARSLFSLSYDDSLLAGIPWFVYSWARDELISSKALFLLGKKDFAKRIVFKWLDRLSGINLRTPLGIMSDSWWLFLRAEEMLDSLNRSEKTKLKRVLKDNLKKIVLSNGIVLNGPDQSTWMDSLERRGALEVNALVLAGCRLADVLKIKNFGKELRADVRKIFFRDGRLKDCVGCVGGNVVRPNVFIAAYVYPELLSRKEWCEVFDNALRTLWLPWGGLSTIDKSSSLFHKTHTGENPESYHNGDSWFWINNLAAIVLHRFGKKRFSFYINKIAEASSKEILKMGAIGHHAELSDAQKLSSKGCLSQAWSAALFVELMFELSKSKTKKVK